MEDNKNLGNETVEETGAENETVDTTGANDTETEETTETTFTQKELDARIQSETDKVRTKYNKKLKTLRETIESLEKEIQDAKPVEKSEQEKDYETRLAALEAREKAQTLNEALDAKGIDRAMAKFLNADVNVDDLATAIDALVTNRNKKNSYVPTGHKSGETMTKEEFKKLSYDEKERLYKESPELYKALAR